MVDFFVVVDASSKGSFNQLCRHRMPGALPFGAKYRLIDFTLSNCKNSDVTNVAIFPYGNYRSLVDHIGSGDRWDLNRRRDGIFILPPKNLNLTNEDSISFQRMYEHQEYFFRSNQKYVIVSPASLVWNVDYQFLLKEHIDSKMDITEVLSSDLKRIKTYIISKDRLMDYIMNYDTVPYRNLSDVFDYAPNLKKKPYVFQHACFFVDGPFALYEANMQLLEVDVRKQLFKDDRPILSKETMSAAARFGPQSRVRQSIVASGAVVEGSVTDSIIGRKVVVQKGAIVTHSVIMNQCVIEAGAKVRYAILDKETRVAAQASVEGSLNQLFLSEKKQTIIGDTHMNVLQISAECHPFIKTGGLADVVGALAVNFSKLGLVSHVMLPLYPKIKEKYQLLLENRAEQIIAYGAGKYKVALYQYYDDNVTYSFIESYDFFDRDEVYGYQDDGDRFAFFSLACLKFLDLFTEKPDIIHLHDWHAGLIPLLIRANPEFAHIKTLMTIHNIEYQGVYDASIIEKVGLKSFVLNHTQINFLELGLQYATKISTVSETYRDELRYAYYSHNLVDVINRRDRDFYGILNGLSDDISPLKDLLIHVKYNLMNVFSAKRANKADLQRRMELTTDDNHFILGMVTRIAEQKGFDILLPALEEVLQDPNIQFVLLGQGEARYVDRLTDLARRYPQQVKLNLGYYATEPNYIYAGADALLMPSRYEPCGTSQMIALRYGTIPIVRQTGGLNDTIEPFDSITKRGNGFKFYNYDARDLIFQIRQACRIFREDKEDWQQAIINAMNTRFWLKDSAKKYQELYQLMRT
ncbi:MAG: glycogen/starch synthase [Candidatus Izemoplasmatales bacterium]|nr:glycogen/starch synthase [Candidatus Izemoplasmatales bacterium]